MPFDSGTILVTIVLSAFGLKYTNNKGSCNVQHLNSMYLFVLIGFSTWTMLPVRANANVNINENKPSDAREVLAYYIENNMALTLYFTLSTEVFCRFRQRQPVS
jgi:hypothetical protein